jgi:DNA-binding IclR family transcriptional regulator
MKKETSTPHVKSAGRVLDLLELLARSPRPLPHSDIGAALRIPKSSLTQLLRGLTARGYVAFVHGPNTYELGRAFFGLLERGEGRFNYASLAQPVLERLSAATGESSSLSIWRGEAVERVCGVDSPQALAYRMSQGARFPLYSTSAGKAVLAALPAAEREALLGRLHLKRVTPATLRSMAELRAQLAQVAKTGVAYSRGENTPGIVAVAMAVRRADRTPLGALNVVVPGARYHAKLDRLCVRALRAAAAEFESLLDVRADPA